VLLRPRSGDGSCLVTDADVRDQSALVATKLIVENSDVLLYFSTRGAVASKVATTKASSAVVLQGLAEIRRSVKAPADTAAFMAWLLGVEAAMEDGAGRVRCANGQLVYTSDQSPVSIGWNAIGGLRASADPDGVPVAASATAGAPESTAALDHVRLNCADLAVTTRFYRDIGLSLSWAGDHNSEPLEMTRNSLDDAHWVHLSSSDGYVSLSQADWGEYGTHTTASGPPRFMHIGLAVTNLDDIIRRLDTKGIDYWAVDGPIGRQLYLNDLEGDAATGMNVELVHYREGVARSGRRS
jgi:catechol 2,3-dioxygenase-like lactoylglutathione lyase family enzyme